MRPGAVIKTVSLLNRRADSEKADPTRHRGRAHGRTSPHTPMASDTVTELVADRVQQQEYDDKQKDRHTGTSRDQLADAVLVYPEVYDPCRRHSALNYLRPSDAA